MKNKYIKIGDRVAHLTTPLGGGTVERVFRKFAHGHTLVDAEYQVMHVMWDNGRHGIHPANHIVPLIMGGK